MNLNNSKDYWNVVFVHWRKKINFCIFKRIYSSLAIQTTFFRNGAWSHDITLGWIPSRGSTKLVDVVSFEFQTLSSCPAFLVDADGFSERWCEQLHRDEALPTVLI